MHRAPSPARCVRRLRRTALASPATRTLLAVLVLGGAACATPAPAPDDDPVGRYLHERGHAPATAPTAPRDGPRGEASDPTGAPAPMQRDLAAELVLTALNHVDLPYKRGGSTTEGFDCSGFTRHVFQASLGVALPRSADEQAGAKGLVSVARHQLEPGDLVFFNTLRRTFSHVGIYVGDGKFVHAPRTGAAVRVEDMRIAYWAKRFTGARRSLALASPLAAGVDPVQPLATNAAQRTAHRPAQQTASLSR
jgi:cell wall-associated NlpC family hydrolase